MEKISEKKQQKLLNLYNSMIKNVNNIEDISLWAKKFTITEKVMDAERTAQQKIKDAIDTEEDEEKVVEGDKIYLYATIDDKLKRTDKWDICHPDHDVDSFIKYIYDTTKIFEALIEMSRFEKYHLKSKKKLLDKLLRSSV